MAMKAGPSIGSAFVRCDRFHQRDELALHRLILDLAVGAQQAEAESRVQEQEAFDFAGLVVAAIEEGHGHIEGGGDLLKPSRADAIDALLVFLHLLEADAELFAELSLRDLHLDATQAD